MNHKVILQCQIEQTWQNKIAKIAADRNTSPEDIATEAIALYLGELTTHSHDRLLALEEEVAVLKQMLSQFNTTITLLQQQQLNTNLKENPPSISPLSMPQPLLENASDEDIEDEPDEILYDFLDS